MKVNLYAGPLDGSTVEIEKLFPRITVNGINYLKHSDDLYIWEGYITDPAVAELKQLRRV